MSKFILIATLFLAMFVGCLTYANAASVRGNSQQAPLTADGAIQKLIGQYEANYQGPSVIHPEQAATFVDPQNLKFP